jgi:hypothetical protein
MSKIKKKTDDAMNVMARFDGYSFLQTDPFAAALLRPQTQCITCFEAQAGGRSTRVFFDQGHHFIDGLFDAICGFRTRIP